MIDNAVFDRSKTGTTSRRRAVVAAAAVVLLAAAGAHAVDRHPTGVNVDSQGATSVFITYGNLQNQVPAEGIWCGELVPADPPDIGLKCAPGSVYGRLPARLEQLRPNSPTAVTDIMSIPASVARRAYQDAAAGAPSEFFYVRRFVSLSGGPDEYVVVTCRMASGGARTPLSLTNVRLRTDLSTPILFVRPGGDVPPIRAEISYTGTGWLRGRWEIVLPGETEPTEFDLLTEASLPASDRFRQRRYQQVDRFRKFLPPTESTVLDGPPAGSLPTDVEGMYIVLLRIEAVTDKESLSDLGAAGGGEGLVPGGGVAGFPMPTFRYFVGSGRSDLALIDAFGELTTVAPGSGAVVDTARPVTFVWSGDRGSASYRIEVVDRSGVEVMAAIVPSGTATYQAPPWLADRAGQTLSWRVTGLDREGEPTGRSEWRELILR